MIKKEIVIIGLLGLVLISNTSCKGDLTRNDPDLIESLEPVEEVFVIEGAESATIKVNINRDQEAYFSLQFSDINANDIIENGLRIGWCIDAFKPINSNNGTYSNIKLYSTHLVEKWKPLNYLLNIGEALRQADPEISWLEIQLAIWSLRSNPKFVLDEINIADLPGQFRRNENQPTYNEAKVREILNVVDTEYKTFDFTGQGVKFAVIAELPEDLQTLITVVKLK
jgi:hypothetical protein